MKRVCAFATCGSAPGCLGPATCYTV
jgi:hypothetical protein